ncbi:hypothetical protein AYJ57_03520 [Salipiger sp. CCB-MM3]|uniref:hypothetical protein n=1 Tax=Salipiger sp. CCB-MM3 TaxID=1792508 RepID=UPI00080AA108|nr:hypothetical protein [Salipiger sp. CCB-MM3]ANT59515.1 hypothetical protein AYJ57_03520 [Salipiger sp. CCB-MM3]
MKKAILIWAASASVAAAHPGHDAALPADGAAHWLLSPLHGLGVLALAGVLVWRLYAARRE